jgi:hypothetical protein
MFEDVVNETIRFLNQPVSAGNPEITWLHLLTFILFIYFIAKLVDEYGR